MPRTQQNGPSTMSEDDWIGTARGRDGDHMPTQFEGLATKVRGSLLELGELFRRVSAAHAIPLRHRMDSCDARILSVSVSLLPRVDCYLLQQRERMGPY
jgi:hypothetical protein